MAENHEKLTPVDTTEADEALERFLGREQQEKRAAKPAPRKLNKRVLIILISLAVVAALVVLLFILRKPRPADNAESGGESAALSLSVNDEGEHEAAVSVNEKGEIEQNGSGSLLSYFPADISRIEVQNEGGSFAVTSQTPEGEATVYTLEGFEDIELQEGIADEVATDAAAVEFLQIVSAGGKPADFGLDTPRATVSVTFHDDTSASIRVGAEAAAGAGTYIAFGSSDAVYLVSNEAVDSFLYTVNQFISLAITDTVTDADNAEFSTLTISGSHFPEPITLVPNTDEALNASYLVTAPLNTPANATESFDIAGAVRGLYADEVVCVNPSADQLSRYGVSDPYAKVQAVYPDATVTLIASAPAEDGSVSLYHPDKNIIYSIQLAAVSWARTSKEALIPEYVIDVKLPAVSEVTFTSGDADYTFDVSTVTETQDDTEVTTTTAVYNGSELDSDHFAVFFQNLNGIKNQGSAEDGGSELLRFTVSYSTGRAADTVTVYDRGSAQYPVKVNGETVGSASKSYIDNLIAGARDLVSGNPVAGL